MSAPDPSIAATPSNTRSGIAAQPNTTIADLSQPELRQRLDDGLVVNIGPFSIRLHIERRLTALISQLHHLYAYYPLAQNQTFADYSVRLYRPHTLHVRRWWQPQVQFQTDGEQPFSAFPEDTALPFLEWGVNYCIANRAHQYLMLHAAALEKNGRALLLPAKPGSGKSTLCTALCYRGWRLLSDEFGLVRPADQQLQPLPRLTPLKNESIAVIQAFAPQAVIGPAFPKTRKGTVAHVRPPLDSVRRVDEPALPALILFPQYRAGGSSSVSLRPFAKDHAFLKLSSNSFNYELIGLRGFELASQLIERCDCYSIEYADLNAAVAAIAAL